MKSLVDNRLGSRDRRSKGLRRSSRSGFAPVSAAARLKAEVAGGQRLCYTTPNSTSFEDRGVPPMPLSSTCSNCGKKLTLSETMLGKLIRCPACKEEFRAAPADGAPPESAGPASRGSGGLLEDLPAAPAFGRADSEKEQAPPEEDDLDALPVLGVEPDAREEPSRTRRDPDRDARWDRDAQRDRDRDDRRDRDHDDRRDRDRRSWEDDWDRDRDRRADRGRRRPPQASGSSWVLGLILGLVALVLVICGGAVGVFYYVGKSVQNKLANPPIPPGNWAAFRPEIGNCIVSMPGTPLPIPVRGLPGDARASREYQLTFSQFDRVYAIAILEFPPKAMTVTEDEKLQGLLEAHLVAVCNGVAPDPGGVERLGVVYQGRMGKEIRYTTGGATVIERALMIRRADGTVVAYLLQVRGVSLRPDSADLLQFFGSLQIDPAGINAKPPEGKPNPEPTPAPERLELTANGRLTVHPGGTQLVRVSPDGTYFAALGEDGIVKLVEVPPLGSRGFWPVRTTLPAIAGPHRGLVSDRTGARLAVIAAEAVHVFDARTGTAVAVLTCSTPYGAAFAPVGDLVAISVRTGDGAGAIHFRQCHGGAEIGNPIPLPAGVGDLVWSSDGSILAVAVAGTIHLLDAHQGKPLREPLIAHTAPVTGLAFTSDSKGLVTVGADKAVKRWSIPDGKLLDIYEGTRSAGGLNTFDPVGGPVFTSDGSRLVVACGPGDEQLVRMWRTTSAQPLRSRALARPGRVGDVDCLRDGHTLLVAVRNEPVRVLDLSGIEAANAPTPYGKARKPEEVTNFEMPGGTHALRFSPDGRTLAVSGREGGLLSLATADWTLQSHKVTTRKSEGGPLVFTANRVVTVNGAGAQTFLKLHNPLSGSLLSVAPGGDGWPRLRCREPERQPGRRRLRLGGEPRAGASPTPGRDGDGPPLGHLIREGGAARDRGGAALSSGGGRLLGGRRDAVCRGRQRRPALADGHARGAAALAGTDVGPGSPGGRSGRARVRRGPGRCAAPRLGRRRQVRDRLGGSHGRAPGPGADRRWSVAGVDGPGRHLPAVGHQDGEDAGRRPGPAAGCAGDAQSAGVQPRWVAAGRGRRLQSGLGPADESGAGAVGAARGAPAAPARGDGLPPDR